MLKSILTISGKPGLYKLLSRGRGMIIVESLDENKKRFPVQGTEKAVTLGDISIFTESEEVPLQKILLSMKEKEGAAALPLNLKEASNEELSGYFAAVLPDYDRERVYVTHIRKICSWYNILVKNGMTDFGKPETETAGDKGEEEKSDK